MPLAALSSLSLHTPSSLVTAIVLLSVGEGSHTALHYTEQYTALYYTVQYRALYYTVQYTALHYTVQKTVM